MTKVSTHLLCLYSDKSAEFGMLKRKVAPPPRFSFRCFTLDVDVSLLPRCPQAQVLREYLQEPLQQVF